MSRESKREKGQNFNLIFAQYKNIALTRFEWTGLPKKIEERYLENPLFEHGMVAFIKDKNLGFLVLPCSPYGGVNVYGEYEQYMCYGIDKTDVHTVGKDCIIIRNNPIAMPTYPYIEMYAKRIAEIENTMDINVSQQRHPYIATCGEKQLLTFKNIFKKVAEGEPVVYGEKSLDIDQIKVLPMLAPFIGIEMMDYKRQVKNELSTFQGINNSNTDKKERLVTDEVNSNNQEIDAFFQTQLFMRQYACKQINDLWGTELEKPLSVKSRLKEVEEDVGTNNSNNNGAIGTGD